MARHDKHSDEEVEDFGVLDSPIVDTTAINVLGLPTSQVRVNLPRGYEDLDNDDDVVDDGPSPLSDGRITLTLPGAASVEDEPLEAEPVDEPDEPAETPDESVADEDSGEQPPDEPVGDTSETESPEEPGADEATPAAAESSDADSDGLDEPVEDEDAERAAPTSVADEAAAADEAGDDLGAIEHTAEATGAETADGAAGADEAEDAPGSADGGSDREDAAADEAEDNAAGEPDDEPDAEPTDDDAAVEPAHAASGADAVDEAAADDSTEDEGDDHDEPATGAPLGHDADEPLPSEDDVADEETADEETVDEETVDEALEPDATEADAARDVSADTASDVEALEPDAAETDRVEAASHDDNAEDPAMPTDHAETAAPRTRASRFVAAPRSSSFDGAAGGESANQLTSDRLVEPRRGKPRPEGAWRGFWYSVSGGLINLGDSRAVRERKDLIARIGAPLPGRARFVPVLSRKGGVGKTTVTTLLGMALADARDDRVVAVDANPDRGTLSERIDSRTDRTVRDVVRRHDRIRGYADISDLVARDATRLDVVASDTDPHVADAFDDADYRTVADVTSQYYSMVLTDTGTGIIHSVMDATLDLADQIVVVAGASVDESRLASETLTWLEAHGRADLVRGAVVVVNQSSPGKSLVRVDEVEAHFASRVRSVVRLPYDESLATGGAIAFDALQPATRQAARRIAAEVIEGMRSAALRPAEDDE